MPTWIGVGLLRRSSSCLPGRSSMPACRRRAACPYRSGPATATRGADPRRLVHARGSMRPRHRPGAGGEASDDSAVRDRRVRLVGVDVGVAADRREVGAWRVEMPAGAGRRPVGQERVATARRAPIGRRHHTGRVVPARQRAGVGRPAVPVLREPRRPRRSWVVSPGAQRGLLGSNAQHGVVSAAGQCSGLRIAQTNG